MEIDQIAKEAVELTEKPASTKMPPAAPKPRAPLGPSLEELTAGLKNPEALYSFLEKELAEDQAGLEKLRQLSEVPIPQEALTSLSPAEAAAHTDEIRKLRKESALLGLLDAAYGSLEDSLIKSGRKLEKLARTKKWDPTTSPDKLLEAVHTRLSQGSKPKSLDGAFRQADEATSVSMRSGIEALQDLLVQQRNKRYRKSLPDIRNMVHHQLQKLMALAADCKAEGAAEGASTCLRAYMELFGVYTKQFQPLAEHLGAKAAVDLVLQVGSPLSDVTPAMWDSLAAQANGGQYAALLKKLDDSIPAAKRPGPYPHKKSKKSARRSSRSSSSSDYHSSSDNEDEDPTPHRGSSKHHKPNSGSADTAEVPKLLTRGFTLLAGAIREAGGSRAHRQGGGGRRRDGRRPGNRDGGGGGGGGGGGKGGRGGK
jgi:hypothetical protein